MCILWMVFQPLSNLPKIAKLFTLLLYFKNRKNYTEKTDNHSSHCLLELFECIRFDLLENADFIWESPVVWFYLSTFNQVNLIHSVNLKRKVQGLQTQLIFQVEHCESYFTRYRSIAKQYKLLVKTFVNLEKIIKTAIFKFLSCLFFE